MHPDSFLTLCCYITYLLTYLLTYTRWLKRLKGNELPHKAYWSMQNILLLLLVVIRRVVL